MQSCTWIKLRYWITTIVWGLTLMLHPIGGQATSNSVILSGKNLFWFNCRLYRINPDSLLIAIAIQRKHVLDSTIKYQSASISIELYNVQLGLFERKTVRQYYGRVECPPFDSAAAIALTICLPLHRLSQFARVIVTTPLGHLGAVQMPIARTNKPVPLLYDKHGHVFAGNWTTEKLKPSDGITFAYQTDSTMPLPAWYIPVGWWDEERNWRPRRFTQTDDSLKFVGTGLKAAIIGRNNRFGSGYYVGSSVEQESTLIYYLATKAEFKALKGKSLTQFWQSRGGEAARQLYLNRIQLANTYFTGLEPGWKTDKGMIFILFGYPNTLILNPFTEIWLYDTPLGVVRFEFYALVRLPGVVTASLMRAATYQPYWLWAIDNFGKPLPPR